jgi:hypothetical protein
VKEGEEKVCLFITAVPITKLFAWGEGDSGGHVLRETKSWCSEHVIQKEGRGAGGTAGEDARASEGAAGSSGCGQETGGKATNEASFLQYFFK